MSKVKTKAERKWAKIRQAVYRGDKPEQIVRKLYASLRQIENACKELEREGIQVRAEWLSVGQAAFLLGVGHSRVTQYIKMGHLTERRIGRNLVIHREEFLVFAERRRTTAGRPPSLKVNGRATTCAQLGRAAGLSEVRVWQLIAEHGRKRAVELLLKRAKEK